MRKRTNLKTALITVVFLVGIVGTAAGQIIYVDPCATGANNGSSWTNAYNHLKDAPAAAELEDSFQMDDRFEAVGLVPFKKEEK